MEIWAWIVAYVVGFGLLQLLVYRYFRESDPSVEQASPGTHDGQLTSLDQSEPTGREPDDGGDGVRCDHCGAYNERAATFRYCRECTTPLQ